MLPLVKIRTFVKKKGQIWPEICIFGHLEPNIVIVGPFDAMPDQKKANKVPRWFLRYVDSKAFASSRKN